MNGYRHWVEHRRLAAWLEEQRRLSAELPEPERQERTVEMEQELSRRLEVLYGQIRAELEPGEA